MPLLRRLSNSLFKVQSSTVCTSDIIAVYKCNNSIPGLYMYNTQNGFTIMHVECSPSHISKMSYACFMTLLIRLGSMLYANWMDSISIIFREIAKCYRIAAVLSDLALIHLSSELPGQIWIYRLRTSASRKSKCDHER